jgi:hypothetical protein
MRIAIAPKRLAFDLIELFISILGTMVVFPSLNHDEPENITL